MKRSREESDESAASSSSFKEQLEDLLLCVSTPGDFACGDRSIEPLCLPGLVVDGLGSLSVPLSDKLAVELKAVCSRAPFGRGESTVYDPAVRDTWQLAPDRFRLSNPAWDGRFLPALVERVKKELGCGDGRVQAELYKLLLYEAGQHFVAHRDTEKSAGMFGTLVVMLPSAYSGGALAVSHGDAQKVFDYAAENHFSMCFAAFYADCKHEIRPIESGYRLCLVYNLIHTGKGFAPGIFPPPALLHGCPLPTVTHRLRRRQPHRSLHRERTNTSRLRLASYPCGVPSATSPSLILARHLVGTTFAPHA